MASTLTLDLGLDFDRVLPGENRGAVVATAPAPPVHSACAPQRGPTLDDLVVGVWEGLRSAHPVACPICDGGHRPALRIRARAGGRPLPVVRVDDGVSEGALTSEFIAAGPSTSRTWARRPVLDRPARPR